MMCLWVSFKGKKITKNFFASLNLWRKDSDPDPEPDPLVRGTDPGIRIRIKLSRITITGIILKWRWSGLVSLWGSSEALLRIRNKEMRIRIPLFTLTRIRIHFSLWCRSGSYSYQSKTNLQHWGASAFSAPFWASRPPLWASTTVQGFILSLHSSWIFTLFGSGSNLSLFTLIRIRIQHPKIMRVNADLDPQHCWKIRIPVILISIVSIPVRIYSEAVVKAGPA